MENKLLEPEDIAKRMGVTVWTFNRWCCQGKVPGAMKVGGRWKMREEMYDQWIAALEEQQRNGQGVSA